MIVKEQQSQKIIVAKPELNGRTGTVVRFDHDQGRYSVELDERGTSPFWMIKPDNLLTAVEDQC